MPAEIRVGVAVELPEGVLNVVGERRYSGLALQWCCWELDDGAGHQRLLAKVGEALYTPRVDSVEALSEAATVEFEGTQYTLRQHGEARAESTDAGGHDFWLAKFRQYVAPGKVLVFTNDRDETHRLAGEELDAKLVQVFQP